MNRFTQTLVIILALFVSGYSAHRSKNALYTSRAEFVRPMTPLYLPQSRYLRTITFGYNNAVADVLWFQTLSYFGKQLSAKETLPWFFHMCSLVSELDPNAKHVYEFCGTLLSWVAQEPAQSSKILDQGIKQFPNYWRFYYLNGFNAWYFDHDKEKAAQYFALAAKCPEAPPLLAGVASRLLVSQNNAEAAVRFLTDLLRNSTSADARKAILERLKSAHLTLAFETLGKAKVLFEQRTGKPLTDIYELVDAGIIPSLPKEPFNGVYSFNQQTGEFETSSNQKRLTFSGKTAELKTQSSAQDK